ncbi:MAG TPA: low molecular weight phosphatase family protein [Pseudolabrys sp.]|nr:low molecular weight phosphatase family protein [Pseudolabrys sp.]
MKTVLFLCTGNFYRSRFAEELFNDLAIREGLAWRAGSRALALERGVNNIGTISPFALSALAERGVPVRDGGRTPTQCSAQDLEAADHIVALKETEHRPLMRARYPAFEARVEYWEVHDIDIAPPQLALSLIDRQIAALLVQLRRRL